MCGWTAGKDITKSDLPGSALSTDILSPFCKTV